MKKLLLGLASLFLAFGGGLSLAQNPDVTDGNFWENVSNGFLDAGEDRVDDIFNDLFDSVRFGGNGNFPRGRFSVQRYQNDFNDITPFTDAREYIRKTINWVLTFLGLICVVIVIVAGIRMIVGGQDEYEKSKKTLMYVGIGIIVILVSFALVNTILRAAENEFDNTPQLTTQTPASSQFSPVGTIDVVTASAFDLGNVAYISTTDAAQGVDFEMSLTQNLGSYWNYGDGIVEQMGPNQFQASHAYGNEQAYTLRVLAGTPQGDIVTLSKKLFVGGVVPQFRALQSTLIAGEDIDFTASDSRTPIGSITDYAWSCTPGCFSGNGESIIGSFPNQGSYDVTLDIETSFGAQASLTRTFTVLGDVPVAGFTFASTNDASKPGEYRFDASSSVNIAGDVTGLTYVWDFDGDVQQVNSPFINYEFDTPGAHPVTLEVRQTYQNDLMFSVPVTQVVNVGTTLSVDISGPEVLKKDILYTFRGESPDATTYDWTFLSGANVSNASGIEADVFYDTTGQHEILLTAGDGNQVNTANKYVYVKNDGMPLAIPQISVNSLIIPGGSTTITRADAIQFGSASINIYDQVGNLDETWVVNGQNYTQSQLGQVFNPQMDAGVYQMRLVVNEPNNVNLRDEASFTITVINTEPVVSNVYVSPSALFSYGEAVVEVNAYDADGDIEEYRFEILENGAVKAAQISDLPEATFDLLQYPGDHEYRIRVRVVDNDGAVTTYTDPNILNIESDLYNDPPVVSIFPSPGTVGTTFTNFALYAQATDAQNDALTYLWYMPDGSVRNTVSTTHQFSQPGSHEVVLEVSDGIDTTVTSIWLEVVVDPNDRRFDFAMPPTVELENVFPGDRGTTETVFTFVPFVQALPGQVIYYNWNFGDGEFSSLPIPSKVYSAPGIYTVTVRVSDFFDPHGGRRPERENEFTFLVEVFPEGTELPAYEPHRPDNTLPTGSIAGVLPGNTGDTMTAFSFFPQASDADGDLIRYEWDFGDGNTSDLRNPSHIYQDPGVYNVELSLTDGIGVNMVDTLEMRVVAAGDPIPSSTINFNIHESASKEIGIGNNISRLEELYKLRAEYEASLEAETDPLKREELLELLIEVNTEIAKLEGRTSQNDTLLALFIEQIKKEKLAEKDMLVEQMKETEDPLEKSEISQKILDLNDCLKLLEENPLALLANEYGIVVGDEFVPFVTIEGTSDTTFFLYGIAPDLERTLMWTWDLGDGRTMNGQNIFVEYEEPKFYVVRLKVTDGLLDVEDSIIIYVKESDTSQ